MSGDLPLKIPTTSEKVAISMINRVLTAGMAMIFKDVHIAHIDVIKEMCENSNVAMAYNNQRAMVYRVIMDPPCSACE